MPRDSAAQQLELGRVQQAIGPTVLSWLRNRIHTGLLTFYGPELGDYVRHRCGSAPESAMRVMRVIRREHGIEVRNVDRARSLYRIFPPGTHPSAGPRMSRPPAGSERRAPPLSATQQGTSTPRASWECECGAADDPSPIVRCLCP